ncbi:MAG TPA: hypothetical protein EYN38_02415 [Flavobacteriales bacterium]|nr:hypothetical protein [Flavobacteriales bacterium]HIA10630.1 hypothetical protein [Flavobacteriales bacterium]HIO71939.1 hypothetical protein [Flavobacteriales bacterium]
MYKKLNYRSIKSIAIVLLFTSLACKFLSGAFLTGELRDTGILLATIGLGGTLLLLVFAVVIEVVKTPPAKRDKDGVLIIYEEEENVPE